MDTLNEQTRLWNSICICTATTNRIIGKDSFRWLSLLLTMLQVVLRVFLCSSLIKDITPTLQYTPLEVTSAKAKEFAVNLDDLHQELQTQISKAQKCYQGPADSHRSAAPDLKIGDFAFIKATFLRPTRPSKKLSEKNLGPFEIIAEVGWLSLTLRLPEQLRAVHPVFHVSQLEPTTRNTIPNRVQPPPPPIEVYEDIEFAISKILDSKIDKRRKCQLLYLVRCTGYEGTDQETDWLSALELTHAMDLVQDFHTSYPHKLGPLNSLNT